jgi:hypothetical protein
VRQEGLHRLRMRLEQVEERDHAHGLHVAVELRPGTDVKVFKNVFITLVFEKN